LKTRTFHVVVVGKGHGAGLEVTESPDKVVAYQGEGQIVADFGPAGGSQPPGPSLRGE